MVLKFHFVCVINLDYIPVKYKTHTSEVFCFFVLCIFLFCDSRSTDMWSMGCLIWEVFNGSFAKNTSLKSPGKVIVVSHIIFFVSYLVHTLTEYNILVL